MHRKNEICCKGKQRGKWLNVMLIRDIDDGWIFKPDCCDYFSLGKLCHDPVLGLGWI